MKVVEIRSLFDGRGLEVIEAVICEQATAFLDEPYKAVATHGTENRCKRVGDRRRNMVDGFVEIG